jgi:uncharacterized protein YndB with AHSA1/START domain
VEDLKVEVVVSAPLNDVWSAWTSSEGVKSWFSPDAKIDPRPGGAFELYFDPANHEHESTKDCVFTEIEHGSSLSFTWKGPGQFAQLMNDPSKVKVTFHDVSGLTRVIVNHGGWRDGDDWAEAREWHLQAWKDVLASLKSVLESRIDDLWTAPEQNDDGT